LTWKGKESHKACHEKFENSFYLKILINIPLGKITNNITYLQWPALLVDWTLHGVHASCVKATLSVGEPCLLVVSLPLCYHYLHNKVEMHTSVEQKRE